MFITVKEWRALSLRNRMLLLEAVANKSTNKVQISQKSTYPLPKDSYLHSLQTVAK